MKRIFWIVFLFNCFCFTLGFAQSKEFFRSTFFPLQVYYLQGELAGPTLMIQGGIQGDELSGVICTQILTLAKVKKGNLILVPRANWPSLLFFQRQINVDLNRRFDKNYNQYYEDTLAKVITYLSSLSDGLIHLHEGSGFYSPTYINLERNPRRYGQSIIIDTPIYQRIYLASLAENVLKNVNSRLHPPDYAFSLFNMNTFAVNTSYPEQKKSLTYNVLKKYNKPAFAVEVSKNIKDVEWKVRHMLLVVKKLALEMGVEFDLDFIDIPFLVTNWFKKDFTLQKKQKNFYTYKLQVLNRGLSKVGLVVDEIKTDFNGKELIVFPGEERKVEIRLDGKEVEKIILNSPIKKNLGSEILVYALDGKINFALPGETIVATEGQSFLIYGLWPNKKEIINIKGYVSLGEKKNEGQDVEKNVYLAQDAFIQRYLNVEKDNWQFLVVRETPGKKELSWKVKVVPSIFKDIELFNVAEKRTYVLDKYIPKGKYIVKTYPKKGFILLLDKYPLPYYNGDVVELDAGKHHLCVRDNYTFNVVREEDIYVSP